MSLDADHEVMEEALALASLAEGLTSPNPLVGAIVFSEEHPLGHGYHAGAGRPHAEINALKAAGEAARGAELFVTLEPCSTYGRTPPCTEAIIAAGIAKVHVATLDPNPAHAGRGVEILRAAGIAVEVGLCEREAREQNRDFFKWIVAGKPWVVLKMAMTLDGRIATASGDSRWITGEAARKRVQHLRRRADAILISGETLRLDHPQLTVREPAAWPRQPRRLVATRSMSQAEVEGYFPDGAAPQAVAVDDWDAWLRELGSGGVMNLLIEGGGALSGGVLQAGEVDELEFHIAPKILGGTHSRPVVGGADPGRLAEALQLDEVTVEWTGPDLIYRARPRND